jgi:hypothetical protein
MNETWAQILTIVISNLGIILWFRKESREDWVRCQNTIDAIREEIKESKENMRIEMKDFHERLLDIEKNRSK